MKVEEMKVEEMRRSEKIMVSITPIKIMEAEAVECQLVILVTVQIERDSS